MMKIVGFKRTEFTAKDTGAIIGGYNFYVTEERKNVVGVYTDSFFVSDNALARSEINSTDIGIGDVVEVLYNRYGKIASIKLG